MPHLPIQDRTLHLRRFPPRRHDPLRPWDAADEYLLDQVRAEGLVEPGRSVLVVNDGFGAVTLALHEFAPVTWSDSHLFRLALAQNLDLNGLAASTVTFVPGYQDPVGIFDLVLLKVPKSLAHLEDILLRLRRRLRPGSVVLAGSMIKHTPARVYRLLERIIGPTRTSLGRKKARLATAAFAPNRTYPDRLAPSTVTVEEFGWELTSGHNVFSRDRLDPGTRLLLAHLPDGDRVTAAADLGCGNGVLALALAERCPGATVFGVDESYQAVACARDNLDRTGLAERDVRFFVGDGLAELEPGSLDTVVCNPPFHQAQTVGDQLAWHMFEQARQALRPGGDLRVVGNRHLGYHVKLSKLFGKVEVLASDASFVVLRAVR